MGLARVGAVQMRGNKTSLDLAIGDAGFYLFLRSGVSGGVSFFLALPAPRFFLVAVVVVPQWGIKLREQSDLSQPVEVRLI